MADLDYVTEAQAVALATATRTRLDANQATAESAASDASDALAAASVAALMVEHGDNPNIERPDTANQVVWVGSVTPLNILPGDIFFTVAPQPVEPGVAWYASYNAESLTGVIANEGAVPLWPDLAGSTDLEQATAEDRPTFYEATGGVPAFVRFANSHAIAGPFGETIAQPLTVIVVVRPTTVQSTGGVVKRAFDGVDSTNSVLIQQRSDGSNPRWQIGAGSAEYATPHAVASEWALITLNLGTTDRLVRINGVSTTVGAGSNGLAGVTLGGRYDQSASFTFNGDIGDVRVYEGDINQASLAAVEAALAAKYGITLP